MKKYIDVPSGWRYGFPKVLPEGVKPDNAWLVANGYPQEEIDRWEGEPIPCGFFQQEDEDERH